MTEHAQYQTLVHQSGRSKRIALWEAVVDVFKEQHMLEQVRSEQ